MKNTLRILMAAAAITIPASAVTTTYDFETLSNQSSNSTLSVFSNAVKISSWSATNFTTTLAAANTQVYNDYGLGVCTAAEGGANCSSPDHQVDNSGAYEFMLFRFSTPVNLTSIQLANFGGTSDMDMTYYTNTSTATSLTLGTINSLGTGWSSANNVGFSGSGSVVNQNLTGTGVTWLLVGASISDTSTKDYFKIDSITVDTVTATPEPSTISLGLVALGVAEYFRRKRARA